MQVFGADCLDVSELNGDGWVVGHNLIASMGQEQSRMSETSVHWLYSHKQNDILVALGANSVWHGLQQATRAFLFEEHDNQVISHLLGSGIKMGEEGGAEYQSHVASIGHWLALRASQRDLVPLAVQAAQLLQIDGYEPITATAGFGKRDINRLLPALYSAWAKKSSKVLGSAKETIQLEFDVVLDELCLDLDELAKRIRQAQDELEHEAPVGHEPTRCHTCWDDYTMLGKGLVQPCRIAFDKCREAEHKYNCACSRYLKAYGVVPARPVAATGDTSESDVEEEFFQEPKADIAQLCTEYDKLGLEASPQGDPFYDAAAMLYQSHGKRWIGEYRADETLCAACFLRREKYIGEDGPGGPACFTPPPKEFVSACPADTFDATYFA